MKVNILRIIRPLVVVALSAHFTNPTRRRSYQTPGPIVHEFLAAMKPAAIAVSFKRDDSPVVANIRTVREQGVRVWASPLWDDLCAGHTDELAVEDPQAAWGWLINHGANIICTDRPAQLLSYLRIRGLHE